MKYQDTTLVNSAARTTSGNGGDYKTYNLQSAHFFLNISAASGTSPTLDAKIQGKDPVSGSYYDLAAFSQKTTTGTARVVVGLGAVDDNNTDAVGNCPLPHVIRASWTIGGTTPSFTFSVGMSAKV